MSDQVISGFKLSPQQEQIWLEQAGSSLPYLTVAEVRIAGALDAAKLQDAVRNIVSRYEILRTVFDRQAGLKVPFQIIRQTPGLAWETAELTGLSALHRDQAWQDLSRKNLAAIDLEHGPTGCAVLATLGPGQHVVAFSLPALCADRRSMRILIAEIGAFYAGDSQESAEVMQYVDFAEWQRELLTGADSKPGRDFWRNFCRDLDFSWDSLLSNFESPGDGAPDLQSVVRHVKGAFSADHVLACWQLFLSRIAGRSTVTVGCEFDGRAYAELNDAIGLFSKYIPIQCSIDADLTFRAFLGQVTRAVSQARNWQDSFAWNQLGLPGDRDQLPDFSAVFEYEEAPAERLYGEVTFTIRKLDSYCGTSRLKLSAWQSPGDLTLEFHYDASPLSRDAVEKWSGHFLTLLAAAAEHPDMLVSKLPLLDESERHKLLAEWNQTAASYPGEQCLHQLFEAQAARTPDRQAVRCQDRQLTYRELNQRANRLAHYLRSLGVGPDVLVGLCLERSVEMIVGLLAILKAGGAYVPLSADNPKPRLAQQMESAVALLTEEAWLGRMPQLAGPTVCLDRDSSRWADESIDNPETRTKPGNLIYAIYTSGSTGVPKGVGVCHRNVVNYATFITRRLELERYPEGLAFATVSTLSADLGNTCIYPSLISGGCLHVIPYEVSTDGRRFQSYAAQYPIDVLKIVPSHLASLLDDQGILPCKYLITGGEALSSHLLEKITAAGAGCQVINHYGPTETTVGSLTLLLNETEWKKTEGHSIPIGRPIANTQIYILDAQREPVPVGVVGELYIAGDGVTTGYLNQPAATAERFIHNPFTDGQGKMYRTGDLARYLADGNVEFLGRADDQVKIRGFRIELGEVEAVLARHPAVQRVAVVAKPDQRGDKRLIAYVTGETVAPDALRAYLKERLPDHMIPSALVILPRLPLTANGKIDRQNLPEPEENQSQYLAPRTPTEIVLAGIWSEVLRRDRVAAEDNFFDIGGNSLLATRVISRISQSLNTSPSIRTMFESPTIAQLAAWIDRTRRDEHGVAAPAITPAPRDGALPLSFAQQRLWLTDQLEPNNPSYNVPRAIRMKGALKMDALDKALNEIVCRHESLRTTFEVRDGNPVQIVAPSLTLLLPLQTFTDLPESEREDAARRTAAEEALQPFDLTRGPLIRTKLLKLASEDHVLLYTTHHIVSDAWSAGIFFQELNALYEAFVRDSRSPLPKLTVQYPDYSVWQRQWLQGEVLDKHLSYWRQQLGGAPLELELPWDRPRTETTSSRGAFETIPISSGLAHDLKNLCRHEDVTLFMTMLAGFQALLSRYSGQDHVVIGTDVANRTSAESERLIGFFINLIPLHTDLSGNPTFRELLARVREVSLGAYAHQDMPFEKLVEEFRPERKLGYNPLVQALFVMQNAPAQSRQLVGLEVSNFGMPVTQSKFDVAVFMTEDEDRLVGYWVYRTDVFERATVLRIAGNFETLLAHAAAQPDTRLSALDIFTEEQKRQQEVRQKHRKQSQYKSLMASEPRIAVPPPLVNPE